MGGGSGRHGGKDATGKGGARRSWMAVAGDRLEGRGRAEVGKAKGSTPEKPRASVAARAAAFA